MTASPRTWRIDRWLLTLLLCAPLVGLLGVVAAEVVPDGRIANHLVRAEDEGIVDRVERDPSPLGTTTDHYSECVAASIGLGDLRGENVYTRAMRDPAYYGCAQMVDKLEVFRDTGTFALGWTYLRYWHGYAVISRPAIAILGLAGTRWIGFALLVVAVGAMASVVKRAFGWAAALLLVTPALLTTDMIVGGLTFSQAIGMATAWTGGWMAFTVASRHPSWWSAALAAALAGSVNAYFDLMTTIPGAMAMTAVGAALGVLAARGIAGAADTWRVAVAAVVGWVVGLGWMWSTKWVFASFALGVDPVVDNVKRQIEFRLSGDYEGVSHTPTRGLTDNLSEWWHQPLTPWVLFGLVVALAVILGRAGGRRPWAMIAATVAVIAVATAGWYAVLNNHTQIHFWMVYRSIPVAVGGLCALIAAAAVVPDGADAAGPHDETPVGLARPDSIPVDLFAEP
jgi:hypothetical protein